MKDKERPWNYHKSQESKKTSLRKGGNHNGLDLGTEKPSIFGKISEIQEIETNLVKRILSIVTYFG